MEACNKRRLNRPHSKRCQQSGTFFRKLSKNHLLSITRRSRTGVRDRMTISTDFTDDIQSKKVILSQEA